MHRLVFSPALLVLTSLAAHSQTTTWKTTNSGSWFDSANWTNGVPNGGPVILSAYGIAGVNGSNPPTITLSGATAVVINLTVGYGNRDFAGPGPANLLVTNGATLLTSLGASIGAGPAGYRGATGSVTLENASTWYTGNSLYVGQTGSGTLKILSGSTVNSSLAWVGYQSGSDGSVQVDGPSSAWNVSSLYVGYTTDGALTVNNGGSVKVASSFSLGESSRGSLVLQNGGSLSITSTTDSRILLGQNATGRGSITIGAADNNEAVAPGALLVGSIQDNSFVSGGSSEIVFNHTSSSYLFDPKITGYISLIQRKGTTILTADNDYYGVSSSTTGNSVTRIYDGTLQLGNGGATGMITGPVDMQKGTLAFNRSDDLSTSLSIADRGNSPIFLTQLGAGDVTLSGPLAPTLNYRLNGSGDLIVTSDFSITGRNDLVNGTIESTGSGKLILTGSLGANFAPVIRSGTLQIGNGGSGGDLGTDTGNLSLAGPTATLAFNRSDDITFTHSISGTGIVRKMGVNNLTLSGAISSAGQFIIEGGTLTFIHDSNFNSQVSGDGTFVKDGATTVYANGRFTQTGGTVVKAGTLTLLGGSIGDTSAFTVESGATLNLSRSFAAPVSGAGHLTLGDNTTFSGALSLTGSLSLYSAVLNTSGQDDSVGGSVSIGSRLLLNGNGRLTLSGDVTGALIQVDDGTLRIGNGGTTGTLGANVRLTSASSSLEIARSDNYALTSTISGNGYLIQSGAGALTLPASPTDWGGTLRLRAGFLTYTAAPTNQNGRIYFEGGALQFHSAFTSDISSRFSNDANQAYRIDTNGQSVTLASALTSSGGTFTKLGGGTLTLRGANTYTGGTFVSAGILTAGTATALPSGMVNAAYTLSGGTLNLANFALTMSSLSGSGGTLALGSAALNVTQSGDTTYAGSITGSGRLIKNGGGVLTLTGASTYSGGTTLNAGVLAARGNAALGAANGALLLDGGTLRSAADILSSRTVTLGNAGGTFDASGGFITFNTGIANKAGEVGSLTLKSGLLTLNGAQTYTGTTTINGGGTLKLANGSLASGTVSLASNAVLLFNGNNTYAGAISGEGRIAQEAGSTGTIFSGAATHTGGTFIDSGRFQLGDGVTDGALAGTVTIASGATFAIHRSGPGEGAAPTLAGAGLFQKDGAGTLWLGDNRNFTGSVLLNAGTLALGSDNALGSGNRGGSLTIAGGEIRAAGSPRTIGSDLILSGDFGLGRLTSFSGNATLTQNVTITSTNPDVDSPVFTSTFSGIISGNYGLTFAEGAHPIGAIVLSGANTYTGATTVTGGKLVLGGGDNRLPVTTTVFLANGATLDLGGNSQTVAGLGSATSRLSGDIVNGTLATASGNVFLQSGTYSNTFAGAHAAARIWIGGDAGATVFLNGVNDMVYTADHHQLIIGHSTTGAAGTVKIGNANALAAAGEQVQIFAGTLDLNGQTGVRAGSIALMSGASGALVNSSSGTTASFANSVILGDGTHSTFGGSGNLSLGGTLSGGGGFSKTGAGSLILSGASTYSGATTVSAGTLFVNGSLGSSPVTVQSGATLGGGGALGGLATIQAGGHLAPGNSPGTLTFANGLTLENGAVLDFELGALSDLILVTGGTLSGPESGTITFNLANAGGLTLGTYTLIDWTGAGIQHFDPADFTFGNLPPGYAYSFGITGSTLQLIVVPEPATAALFLAFASLSLTLRRRP